MQRGSIAGRAGTAGDCAQPGVLNLPPRWRLVDCVGEDPLRAARQALHSLLRPAPWAARNPFSCSAVAVAPGARHVLAAVHSTSIGCAVASLYAPLRTDSQWLAGSDLALLQRGFQPQVLRLVKEAALAAHRRAAPRLSSFALTPLPHRPGELLLRHSGGWTGRAIAWRQECYLLALAWESGGSV